MLSGYFLVKFIKPQSILFSMLQAIIFDHDGTMFPTSLRQENWFRYYSQLHDKAWPFRDFAEFLSRYNIECAKSGGVQNFYDLLGLPCNLKDKSHHVWSEYHRFNQTNPAKPYEGMVETIKQIWELGAIPTDLSRNKRLKLGINTTNSWESIKNDIALSGLRPYFDVIITDELLQQFNGSEDVELLKKPSKTSLIMMLETLGSETEYTLHVGDTRNDLISSQKVLRLNMSHPKNIRTVGACYGYEGRTILEQGVETAKGTIHFDYLIDKPSELIQIVKNLTELSQTF